MSLTFNEAEPITESSAGRAKEPNPYTEVIAEIAGKVNEKTKKPIAKSFTLTHTQDSNASAEVSAANRKRAVDKVKRQTSDAGAALTPPVTVKVKDIDLKTGAKGKETVSTTACTVVFWTVPRQVRTRKPAEAK